jgi:hypothetical protein
MIVSTKRAERMFCPMGAGSPEVVMCCGPNCMAWRRLSEEYGFCGMCPQYPDIRRDQDPIGVEFSEEF